MRLLSLVATFAFLAFMPLGGHAREVVFATLNDNVRKQVNRFSQLETYLERELKEVGVTNVTLEVFQDPEALTQSLKDKQTDFYFDSPLIAAQIGQPAGAEFFLRRWKRGVGKYHSVIFVKTSSGIRTLDDLRGKRIAMQDPESTSGYLLPVSVLTNSKLPVSEVKSKEGKPAGDKVGYIFTGDDKNTALWVAKGLVEAGATDNITFAQLGKVAPGQYRSLVRSIELPRQVVLKRSGLEPGLTGKMADILTSMHRTEEGREILQKFNKTTKFERFDQEPDEAMAPLLEILGTLSGAGIIEW